MKCIMFKNYRYLYMTAAVLGFAACSNLDEGKLAVVEQTSKDVSHKIVHTKAASDASLNVVLVKLEEGTELPGEAALAKLDIVDVEPVFILTGENGAPTELEAEFGLDRWYALHVKTGADLNKIAQNVASRPEVKHLEYNIKFELASDGIAYPYSVSAGSSDPTGAGAGIFNDPGLADQWHYDNAGYTKYGETARQGADVNLPNVWKEATAGDPSVIVAVIDQGVYYNHPDLAANMWVNTAETPGDGIDNDNNGYIDDVYGYNFVEMSGDITWDISADGKGDNGHGTHCAGTIAAVNNNGIGVAGVAGGNGETGGVKIMSCQIFSGTNGGDALGTARAFKYAADMGATIASCSFGYTSSSINSDDVYLGIGAAEKDAIDYFEAKNNGVLDGGVVIFSAGNETRGFASYPGACEGLISVSSIGPDYLPAYYTNYGPGCEISAPGGDFSIASHYNASAAGVLSTLPEEFSDGTGYGYMQGTSMACPHVSGVAALGASYAKKLGKTYTSQEFKTLLMTSTNDFESLLDGEKVAGTTSMDLYDYRKKMGSGNIDAWKFIMQIEGTPTLIAGSGVEQWLSLAEYFGGSYENLYYFDPEVSEEAAAELGLEEAPYIKEGKLWIKPTKVGAAKITVTAVSGVYDSSSNSQVNGSYITREVSISSCVQKTANNGGWL